MDCSSYTTKKSYTKVIRPRLFKHQVVFLEGKVDNILANTLWWLVVNSSRPNSSTFSSCSTVSLRYITDDVPHMIDVLPGIAVSVCVCRFYMCCCCFFHAIKNKGRHNSYMIIIMSLHLLYTWFLIDDSFVTKMCK